MGPEDDKNILGGNVYITRTGQVDFGSFQNPANLMIRHDDGRITTGDGRDVNFFSSDGTLSYWNYNDEEEEEDFDTVPDTPPTGSLLAKTEVEIDDEFWQAIISLQFKKLDWSMKRVIVQACYEEELSDKPVIDAVIDYWHEKDSILYYFIDKLGIEDFFPLVEGDDYDEPWDNMVRNVFIFLKGLAKQDIDTVAPIPEDF